MGGCGCNFYKKLKNRAIEINSKTLCWHQDTHGTWLQDGAHQTSKYSPLTVKHVYRCGTKNCVVVTSACRQDMRTVLISDRFVVALRVFHKLVTDDSYNIVTMKIFYFEILYWNLWWIYWPKLIKKFSTTLYFQNYISNRVETTIKMGKWVLQHEAIWGKAT